MDNSGAQIGDFMLEVRDLSKRFRGLKAVEGYQLALAEQEILGVIGPNGAGKSTVFNLLSGHIRPTTGRIVFRGQDITKTSPDQIAGLGMGRTFQNIRLFSSMTVLQNVTCAEQLHVPARFFSTIVSSPRFRERESGLVKAGMEALELFNLADKANLPALSLPYGDQRRLEIVRALALRPKLLLLDEPTAGMSPRETAEVLDLVRRIHEEYHLTIIIVEHNMPLIMRLCTRVQVLNYGTIIAEGSPEQVRNDPRVIESYLGRTG